VERWKGYLDGLSANYAAWQVADPRSLGFLLYHWQALRGFRELGVAERFGGVKPITEANLAAIGAPYPVRIRVPRGDIEALVRFSSAIEQWQRGALARMAYSGHEMEDPARGVYLLDFWRLQSFIVARFEQKLRTFRDDPLQPIAEVIGALALRHHDRVPGV
jgi:hypothetical protein